MKVVRRYADGDILFPLLSVEEDESDFIEWDSLDACFREAFAPKPVLIG